MEPQQRFYRHFLDSVAIIQNQIDHLGSMSNIAGERQEAHNHVLASIAKLQNGVADAKEYTPSYDRKQYADSIKALQEKLAQTVQRVTPRSRFQFRRPNNEPHIDMGRPENDPRLNPGHFSPEQRAATFPPSSSSSAVQDGDDEDQLGELPVVKNYNEELSKPSQSSIRKPSFSAARQIGISNQTRLHIILPISASKATAAGSLTELSGCIVDMSVPTLRAGSPFPGLALKNIKGCLIVAGRVGGPVHITGVKDSIIVVAARQVRIHECSNVDLYLHCASHPIIEDCSGMRFAPLPDCYITDADRDVVNQWDQVDDFKWLKADHSPNWATLSETERLGPDIWTKVVPGLPGHSVDDTLKKCGLPRS
ncbi:hypothetical protein N3K66_003130 [Trichothecium roseum]|uniref:Uncharacterized protein n=1 Tax=Trichothecium roseum TaxID=47278 RepID=A0ACC0V4L3_9HYPO|nr:hypothetical protein N3K66_003130 [Trichothecium roseum]